MRLDSIVIGMDFSDPAVKSAKWTTEQFAPHAGITLVHVIAPPDRPRYASPLLPTPEETEAAARDFAETHLRELATFLSSTPPSVEIRVGNPHEEIAAVARERRADLVVIGPHGERPRRAKFLGSTADRIVRTSPVPVLVATNPPAHAPKRILVPVDDADITPAVLATAHDLAAVFDADVTLLHVWSNAAYSHVASMAYAQTASDADALEAIDADLRAAGMYWLEELARTGIARDRVTSLVTYGSAGDSIVDVATAERADLIVMGRHGAGLVAPALLGSTVSSVLHGAQCPVLVVTEPLTRE